MVNLQIKIFLFFTFFSIISGTLYLGYRYVKGLQDTVTSQAEEIIAQDIALQTNQDTIDNLNADIERNSRLRAELQERLDNASDDLVELRRILSEHNLTNLANSRPGLIESRINDGTQEAFDSIELITRTE